MNIIAINENTSIREPGKEIPPTIPNPNPDPGRNPEVPPSTPEEVPPIKETPAKRCQTENIGGFYERYI
jgi:hypothetical protein